MASPDFVNKTVKKFCEKASLTSFWLENKIFTCLNFCYLSRQNDVAKCNAAAFSRDFYVLSILPILLVKSHWISGMLCKTVFLRIFMSYEICLPGIGLDWWPLLWPWLLSSHHRFHGACEFLASMSSLELQITTTFIKIGGLVFC